MPDLRSENAVRLVHPQKIVRLLDTLDCIAIKMSLDFSLC